MIGEGETSAGIAVEHIAGHYCCLYGDGLKAKVVVEIGEIESELSTKHCLVDEYNLGIGGVVGGGEAGWAREAVRHCQKQASWFADLEDG